MALIDDRDLLIHEPSLFLDASSVATSVLSATDGIVSSGTLFSSSSDFETPGIEFGYVVVVNGEALEVISRTDQNKIVVSKPRLLSTDTEIEPDTGSSLNLEVLTFARLIAEVQAWVLGAFGIDASDPVTPLDETAILNPEEVESLIALRTLARAFAAASAIAPTDSSLSQRATLYAGLAAEARRQTKAVIDLDGDGIADATRHLDVVSLKRS
ncbi:MAG: hypothetical protein IH984_15150 [Planctomycetes bacterium]|nr:hypothetical protein [Planctomycetota bacterium]